MRAWVFASVLVLFFAVGCVQQQTVSDEEKSLLVTVDDLEAYGSHACCGFHR